MKKRFFYIVRHPSRIPLLILTRIPYFRFIRETQYITFSRWFKHKVLNIGGNRKAYWPVHPTSSIYNPSNILIGVEVCPGIMGGCYIQGVGRISLGDYTQIAPNVSIISSNHDVYDSTKHIDAEVKIGKYCWLGAGSIVLPGVELGDFTIVGAGAVVTKSFPEGYCIIAGNPAKVIRELDRSKCVFRKNEIEYIGYIKKEKFQDYRRKNLSL